MIGSTLSDRYEIVSELGRGGMGVVYKARDPRLNRDVAVKLIPPSLLSAEAEQRFESEARLVAQMDHPAIVPIFDYGRHQDSLFFVMPVVEGTNLRRLIRDQDLRLGDVIDIGVAAAEALDYSHARNVVHRDIKPENIMVSREDAGGLRVRVMDFGLARASEGTRITRTGALIGTMAYLSPEQVSGASIGRQSDIYSLGTVLYECVANDVPFPGEVQSILYRIVHEIPQPPSTLGAEVDPELEALILSCLEKEPDGRPASAADLAKALKQYRGRLRDTDRNKSVFMTRTTLVARPALSPFVGRKNELKELQQRLNAAVAGECQFVLLSGEPGVGKTRLLDELENLARAREIRVLHGRPVEQNVAFPYHGLCELIQDFFQQKDTGSAASGLPDLSDLAGELVSLFPMLGEIEAIRTAASGTSQPSEPAQARMPEDRTQIFELLAKTLTRLAAGKPLVLMLEDLHGAEVSIEALQYIVRRLGPTPTLIVGTYRSTEVDKRHPLNAMAQSFEGDKRFAAIPLSPFSPSELRNLLTTLVGGSEVAEDLAGKIHEVSEGNPFFTKELVRSLMDAGTIVQDNTGSWNLSGGMTISSDALPATIQQAVEKRVARLPDEQRDLLSIASVMGKTFDFQDLETLAGEEGDVDEAVERLIREGLIEEDRQSRGDRLVFTSGVVREVLYGELSRRKRRSLHRKFAKVLEKRHAGRTERVAPQLVYHYGEGDVPEKTVEYGLLHAKRSLETFSPDEAIRSVKAALEYLDEEWEGDPVVAGEARMLFANACQMSGDTDASLREFESAVKVFERTEQPRRAVEALLTAARASWHARRIDDTRRWVERGMSAARAAEDTDSLRSFLSLAATMATFRGEHAKAGEYAREAEKFAPESVHDEAGKDVPSGGTLVVSLASAVTVESPALMKSADEWEILPNVYEPLLRTDEGGNLSPHLCTRWETQDDGRTFSLTIRDGVRFQDGHPLDAAGVKDSFERAIRDSSRDLPSALAPIRGVGSFLEGSAPEVEGLAVRSGSTLEIRLDEPLPIYPALLSDARVAITREGADGEGGSSAPVGTGPFRMGSRTRDRVTIERHAEYWTGVAPKLDAVEFRSDLDASAVGAGLRKGELDVAGILPPDELDRLLRDSRFRGTVVEAPRKFTFLILFNTRSGPIAREETIRKALAGVVRARDLVWRTVGRFAHPASGLLPPGILGHDPGRRRHPLSTERASELLRSGGTSGPIRLKAAISPTIQSRFGDLLDGVWSAWSELGAEVSNETPDRDSFIGAHSVSDGLDLIVFAWGPDYDDPDNFTHTLFHSASGQFRHFFSSPGTDELLERARTEKDPSVRQSLYREFEDLLLDSGTIVPLFHDIEYRIAGPHVRRLKIHGGSPSVNYHEIGKAESGIEAGAARQEIGGTLNVPMQANISSLDPAVSESAEVDDVLSCLFETLTRTTEDGRVVPWLAAGFKTEDGGKRYRFRLRDNVRFHDGRRLTARDVRYTFERCLQCPDSKQRWLFSIIRGAASLLAGEKRDLDGFVIHSGDEFSIELENPLSFFPGLLCQFSSAIVPEGTETIGRSRQQGLVGTGPFRAVRFEPGRSLELERNPDYWRDGIPRSGRLNFTFDVDPKDILSGFRDGRHSLAADLLPDDLDSLLKDPEYARGFREAPRLTTIYIGLNCHKGPLSEVTLRRRLARALDVQKAVRRAIGHRAIPASGMIPPGLLGSEPSSVRREESDSGSQETEAGPGPVELSAAVVMSFSKGKYAGLFREIEAAFQGADASIRVLSDTMDKFSRSEQQGLVDLVFGGWLADYADADSFVRELHSVEGKLGRMVGSPEIDRLIAAGRTETDPAARHSVYRQIEETLAREARLIPLLHDQGYCFARPEVEGLSVSSSAPKLRFEDLRVVDRRG